MRPATNIARAFRKSLTKHEARLWIRLKALRSEGFHIRRQAPFRGYFLDFVCFDRTLVVELDGASHEEENARVHDRVRDAVLRREGFEVLRFWNSELDDDIERVMTKIVQALVGREGRGWTASRLPHPGGFAAVPPHEGEGGEL